MATIVSERDAERFHDSQGRQRAEPRADNEPEVMESEESRMRSGIIDRSDAGPNDSVHYRIPEANEGSVVDFNEEVGTIQRRPASQPKRERVAPEPKPEPKVSAEQTATYEKPVNLAAADLIRSELLRRAVARGQQQQAPASAQPRKPLDDVDFFASPKDAIGRAVEEAIQPLKQLAETEQRRYTHQAEMDRRAHNSVAFQEAHPDAADILGDPAFGEWVSKSKYRQALLKKADAYHADAADELLGTWKQLRGTAPAQQRQQSQQQRASSAKIYRRSEILDLMQNNPGKYELLADEFSRAYLEGRVK